MSKKISAARAASLKVKTQSITSKLPETRNADGSVKERDKTGGKKLPAVVKPAKVQADATKEPKGSAARENVGKPWTDSEDKFLRDLVSEGRSNEGIAKTLGRTVAGVEARIEKLAIFKAPPAVENKPGNGKQAVTIAQVAASAVSDKQEEKPAEVEALAPAQTIELPLHFLAAALSIAPKDDTRYYLNG